MRSKRTLTRKNRIRVRTRRIGRRGTGGGGGRGGEREEGKSDGEEE